jgi:outer membrane protein assembly factor BamB
MKRWFWCGAVLAVAGLFVGTSQYLRSAPFDWPQWQGPDRTNMSKETGLLKTWPKDGPPLVWKAKDLGGGFSTPTVANGKIYGMSYKGQDEVVWCINEKDGSPVWTKRIAAARKLGHGEGSRSSPTVDGDVIYVLGTSGDLVCMKVADGSEVWHKNLVADFKGGVPGWGYCESVLIDGDRLICTPGSKDATLVCLNKKTAEVIWKGPVPEGDGAAYSSVIIGTFDGKKQYIQFLGRGVVGLSEDGKFLWRYNKPANTTANCSTPIYHDGMVFAASDYGTGGGMAKLTKNGDGGIKAEEAYFTKQMKNHHGGMILLDGYVYGSNEGLLTCLDFKTGEVKWEARQPGKGSLTFAEGRIYYRNEGGKGMMYLVEATPEKYVELGKFDQPDRSHSNAWAHPVIANGKLFILDQDVLLCYDIKEKK